MALFENIKAKLEERRRQKQLAAHQVELEEWQQKVDLVQSTIDIIEEGGMGRDHPDWDFPIQLQKGETIYAVIPGVSLIEPRRVGGQWQGGASGFSFRIAKGVRYRVGSTRGTYVPGPEVITRVDEGGTVYITNKRVMYLGSQRTTEWKFANLLGFQHDEEMGATFLQVSNRQKVSGFLYGQAGLLSVQLRLAAALAHYNETSKDLRAHLEDQLRELNSERPALPPRV